MIFTESALKKFVNNYKHKAVSGLVFSNNDFHYRVAS